MATPTFFLKRHFYLSFVLTLLTAALVFFAFWFVSNYISPGTGQQQAEAVIKALDAYYVDHNKYPALLDDLTPNYLSSVPMRGRYQAFSYQVCPDGKDYVLGFRRGNPFFYARTWGYSSAIPEWHCFDGSAPPYYLDLPCRGHVPSFKWACERS
jgi:hypothetical protein